MFWEIWEEVEHHLIKVAQGHHDCLLADGEVGTQVLAEGLELFLGLCLGFPIGGETDLDLCIGASALHGVAEVIEGECKWVHGARGSPCPPSAAAAATATAAGVAAWRQAIGGFYDCGHLRLENGP